jgi:hypothetical protein
MGSDISKAGQYGQYGANKAGLSPMVVELSVEGSGEWEISWHTDLRGCYLIVWRTSSVSASVLRILANHHGVQIVMFSLKIVLSGLPSAHKRSHGLTSMCATTAGVCMLLLVALYSFVHKFGLLEHVYAPRRLLYPDRCIPHETPRKCLRGRSLSKPLLPPRPLVV